MKHAKTHISRLPGAMPEQEVRIQDPNNPDVDGYWRVVRIQNDEVFVVRICDLDAPMEERNNWKEILAKHVQEQQPIIKTAGASASAVGMVINPEDK